MRRRRLDPAYREREAAYSRERYYSTDPEVHRKVSAKMVRDSLARRRRRIDARQPRPPISFSQLIDTIIREELNKPDG
jgi:hypothetical protein